MDLLLWNLLSPAHHDIYTLAVYLVIYIRSFFYLGISHGAYDAHTRMLRCPFWEE